MIGGGRREDDPLRVRLFGRVNREMTNRAAPSSWTCAGKYRLAAFSHRHSTVRQGTDSREKYSLMVRPVDAPLCFGLLVAHMRLTSAVVACTIGASRRSPLLPSAQMQV